jgi:tetratricopeptide (TPR) repeat protein
VLGAIEDYHRAIQLNPRLPVFYSNRGNVRQDRGDLEGSIADYDFAIKLDPSFAKAYGNRGLARLLQGNRLAADEDFYHCLKLEPKLKPLLEEQIERAKQKLTADHGKSGVSDVRRTPVSQERN